MWIIAFKGYDFFRILGSLVPSIVGYIYMKHSKKGESVSEKTFWQQLLGLKMPWYVFVFIFTYSFLSFLVPYLITYLLKFDIGIFTIQQNVLGFNISKPPIALGYFLLILFIGGPLGEEIGWRGYLLQKLEQFIPSVVASILVGIVWTGWHLPMFIFHISGYDIPLVIYLLQTIYLSLIFTWVFHKSNRSIGAVILFHTMDNFVCSICYQPLLNSFNLYSICYWSIQFIIACYIIYSLLKYD